MVGKTISDQDRFERSVVVGNGLADSAFVRRDRKEVELESSEERREIVSEFGGDFDRTFSLPNFREFPLGGSRAESTHASAPLRVQTGGFQSKT
jgi:hypothetical protein